MEYRILIAKFVMEYGHVGMEGSEVTRVRYYQFNTRMINCLCLNSLLHTLST